MEGAALSAPKSGHPFDFAQGKLRVSLQLTVLYKSPSARCAFSTSLRRKIITVVSAFGVAAI
jgi:hypothetical protein